jgi:hypothetical protein
MNQKTSPIANVDYLWKKCNQLLKTNYDNPSKQVINVEYVLNAANKIDDDEEGFQTEPDFTTQLTPQNKNQIANTIFVDTVLDCVNLCARSCHSCTGTCYGGCAVACGGCSGCNGCDTACTGCTNVCTGEWR